MELIVLTLTVATFMVALVGTYFAWQNHRARVRSEVPEIHIVPRGSGLYRPDQVMMIHFKLRTNNSNYSWRVVRVEVIKATPRECLRHAETGRGSWKDFDDFDQPVERGDVGELDVRPGCNELVLRFLCERPRKRWWKRSLDQERKWVGPISTSWLLQTESQSSTVHRD